MVTTVSVNAYNLDSYAEGSGEVAAWVNFLSHNWRLHHQLLPSQMGSRLRNNHQFWRSSCDLRRRICTHLTVRGVRQEIEATKWASALPHNIGISPKYTSHSVGVRVSCGEVKKQV